MIFTLVIIIITVALLFDFLNGFHDAANAISTIVITKTLTPLQAVVLAGIMNFVGILIFGVTVANTIGKGVINTEMISSSLLLYVILSGLLGAVVWNIITWLLGLPTSSSHALIGGLIGAGITAAGFKIVILKGLLTIVGFIIFAPLLGFIGAILFTLLIIRVFWKINPKKASKVFKFLQLFSASFYALGHGTNDAQKSMGIIAMALFAGGITQAFHVDRWIIIACYTAISLGTMFGGWRIVKTMGTRITKIHAMEGFCAETSSAVVLLITAHFGIPVSTTHVIAGSIMGVGSVERAAGVRWITARKILWAWLLTIPLTAICSALIYQLIMVFHNFFAII
jgi:inorganic phosphate transporter, PiT family